MTVRNIEFVGLYLLALTFLVYLVVAPLCWFFPGLRALYLLPLFTLLLGIAFMVIGAVKDRLFGGEKNG